PGDLPGRRARGLSGDLAPAPGIGLVFRDPEARDRSLPDRDLRGDDEGQYRERSASRAWCSAPERARGAVALRRRFAAPPIGYMRALAQLAGAARSRCRRKSARWRARSRPPKRSASTRTTSTP